MDSRVLFLVLIAAPLSGQVSETHLKSLYGGGSSGSYRVRPGVTLQAYDKSADEVCIFTVSGPATEQELWTVLDEAVPVSARGSKLSDLMECTGSCQTVRTYEKLTISFAVMPGQLATPAAVIESKSTGCEHLVKAAEPIGFSITRTEGWHVH